MGVAQFSIGTQTVGMETVGGGDALVSGFGRGPQFVDPATTFEIMWVSGFDLEAIAVRLMAEFGANIAANTLAIRASRYPLEALRGLCHLATMGVSARGIAARLEAMNISVISLVATEMVPVSARIRIAEDIWGKGSRVTECISPHGLRFIENLEYLDDGLVVDGSLALYHLDTLEYLPERLRVEKVLDVWGCHDFHVGNDLVVGGMMRVRGCQILSWPQTVDVAALDIDGEVAGAIRHTAVGM